MTGDICGLISNNGIHYIKFVYKQIKPISKTKHVLLVFVYWTFGSDYISCWPVCNGSIRKPLLAWFSLLILPNIVTIDPLSKSDSFKSKVSFILRKIVLTFTITICRMVVAFAKEYLQKSATVIAMKPIFMDREALENAWAATKSTAKWTILLFILKKSIVHHAKQKVVHWKDFAVNALKNWMVRKMLGWRSSWFQSQNQNQKRLV